MVGIGLSSTTTSIVSELAEQPFPSVTAAQYEPVLETVIVCEVAPVFHIQLAPSVSVRSTLPPSQNWVGPLGVMVGVGNGLTVTSTPSEAAEHPLTSVTVTT